MAPDDGMRAELLAAVPGIGVLAGTAEAIPLADHAVDAVVVAQAWHWFTAERAVPEIARVLRPGGRVGVARNVRDDTGVGRGVHADHPPGRPRARLLDDVDALARAHPDLAGRAEIDLPYRTECWRATLSDR